MSQKTIGELYVDNPADPLDGTELFEIEQGGASTGATGAQIKDFVFTGYTTGWVANSDWTDAELVVTHSLGANLSDLIVKFSISTDGTEANSFEVAYGHNGASNGVGFTLFNTSTSAFKLQTGSNGILYVDDSGVVQLIDTENWYYKISVYYLPIEES